MKILFDIDVDSVKKEYEESVNAAYGKKTALRKRLSRCSIVFSIVVGVFLVVSIVVRSISLYASIAMYLLCAFAVILESHSRWKLGAKIENVSIPKEPAEVTLAGCVSNGEFMVLVGDGCTPPGVSAKVYIPGRKLSFDITAIRSSNKDDAHIEYLNKEEKRGLLLRLTMEAESEFKESGGVLILQKQDLFL